MLWPCALWTQHQWNAGTYWVRNDSDSAPHCATGRAGTSLANTRANPIPRKNYHIAFDMQASPSQTWYLNKWDWNPVDLNRRTELVPPWAGRVEEGRCMWRENGSSPLGKHWFYSFCSFFQWSQKRAGWEHLMPLSWCTNWLVVDINCKKNAMLVISALKHYLFPSVALNASDTNML